MHYPAGAPLDTFMPYTQIQHYEEFRTYYERKVNEGKHEQAMLNAIKSKMVVRAVAVINNQQPYVNNYKKVD
jgi:transposase